MIGSTPSAAVINACRTADAVNLVLALQTLTEAEQVLRGRRTNLEDRLRHEAIHQAAKSKAEALLRHNNINPEIMWEGFPVNQPENPSAFPEVPGDFNAYEGRAGMTLRDWFAGQFLSRGSAQDNEPLDVPHGYTEGDRIEAMRKHWSMVAEAAYIAADAMLAQRAKGGAA